MCGRQFTLPPKRMQYNNKPMCPKCGSIMHLYKREKNVIRFRCSKYPECKTFNKINEKGGKY
jgi:ssDNA-binding Zn-finger/Zn-ribbon topoisomerase 1